MRSRSPQQALLHARPTHTVPPVEEPPPPGIPPDLPPIEHPPPPSEPPVAAPPPRRLDRRTAAG